MKTVTVAELEKARREGALVLDVREPAEHEAERIEGARLLPLSALDASLGDLPKDRPVFVHCLTGMRARQAAERLEKLGYGPVHVAEGGITAWKEAGLPVITGESKVWALDRQVRFVAGGLVFAGAVLGFLVHPRFFWLAGFVGLGLMFAAVTDFCPMALVIARMPWNQKSCAKKTCC